MKKKVLLLALIVIIFDRAIKLLIAHLIPYQSFKEIIPNFFNITYVKNYGAAWSLLSGNRIILIMIAILALGLIAYILNQTKIKANEMYCYGLLVAGIVGNLIDRIFLGYVVDYLEVIIFNYRFPIFNLADIAIVISVVLISYFTIKEGEENEWIYSRY